MTFFRPPLLAGLVLLLALLEAACGGSPTPKVEQAGTAVDVAATDGEALEEPSRAPEEDRPPPWLRVEIASVSGLVDALSRHVPDARQLVAMIRMGAVVVLGTELGSRIQDDGPALLLADTERMLLAVRLRPLDDSAWEALEKTYRVEQMAGGARMLTPLSSSEDHPFGPGATCMVLPKPTSLACAKQAGTLRTFGPMAAAALAQPGGTQFRLSIAEQGLKEALARSETGEEGTVLSRSDVAARNWVRSLVRALRTLDLDLHLTDDGAKLGVEVRLRDAPDQIVAAALAHPTVGLTGAPVPGTLPDDTLIALSFQGVAPEALEPAAAGIWEQVGKSLGTGNTETLSRVLLDGGPLLFALGMDGAAALEAIDRVRGQSKAAEQKKRAALQAWWALGLVGEDWDVVRQVALDAAKTPAAFTIRPTPAEDDEPAPTILTSKKERVRSRDRLPSDAVIVRLDEAPNPDYQPAEGEGPHLARTAYLVIAKGDGVVWAVSAENRAMVTERARTLIRGGELSEAHRRFFQGSATEGALATGFVRPGLLPALAEDEDTSRQLPRSIAALRRAIGSGRDRIAPMALRVRGYDEGDTARGRLEVEGDDAVLRALFQATREKATAGPQKR